MGSRLLPAFVATVLPFRQETACLGWLVTLLGRLGDKSGFLKEMPVMCCRRCALHQFLAPFSQQLHFWVV